jgi:hypothetical protein
MRLGEFWGTWPAAKLEFTPAEIRLDFFGQHFIRKEDVERVLFLRGTFTCDIHIHHQCDWSNEAIRFSGFGSLRHLERFAVECGYPCEARKKRFYEKADIEFVD